MILKYISFLSTIFLLVSCGGGSADCNTNRAAFGFLVSPNCQENNVKSTAIEDVIVKIKNTTFFMNSSAIINQP